MLLVATVHPLGLLRAIPEDVVHRIERRAPTAKRWRSRSRPRGHPLLGSSNNAALTGADAGAGVVDPAVGGLEAPGLLAPHDEESPPFVAIHGGDKGSPTQLRNDVRAARELFMGT
jgi:hypothetical protein